MGLLDDAIREHLELRRRAGADPSEVANMEQEALGPVVRGAVPSADPALEPDPALAEVDEHQLAIDEYPEVAQPSAYGDAPIEAVEPERQPEVSLPLDAEPLSPHAPDLDPAPLPPEPAAPVAEPAQYVPPAGAGQPTEEYDVEAAHGIPPAAVPPSEQHALPAQAAGEAPPSPAPETAGEEPGEHAAPPVETGGTPPGGPVVGEDVLEQTPEFLEETPEHDRLWFEQAPPKDFDFDK